VIGFLLWPAALPVTLLPMQKKSKAADAACASAGAEDEPRPVRQSSMISVSFG
jgi:hypothetical protein